MNIGWVGLGSIGTNMVTQALAAGHQVTVFARGKGLDAATAAGAGLASDYTALATGCDVLGLCLFSDAQLLSVLLDEGALAAMRPGSIVAIHTTGAPDVAREIGAKAPAGVAVLDATFSGGPANVLAADLTLMIGGEADAVRRAQPLFETYAKEIFHLGPLGHGQMMKLLNNLLFATNLRNATELLKLAQAQGFATQEVARVIQACSGASYAMRSFANNPSMSTALASSRPYLEKDVATVAATAAKIGLDIAAFEQIVEYFRKP